MKNKEELKNCPFCKAELIKSNLNGDILHPNNECVLHGMHIVDFKAWNTRAEQTYNPETHVVLERAKIPDLTVTIRNANKDFNDKHQEYIIWCGTEDTADNLIETAKLVMQAMEGE